jgi:hypothetical protein
LFAGLLFGRVAVLYAFVEWFLYLQYYDPVPPPCLRIPTDQYYALARAVGHFEARATATAWSIGVATLFTLLPDLFRALGVYARWDPTGHTWIMAARLYLIA